MGGVDVTWLGAEGGMELDKVPPSGIEVDPVHVQGLRGKGLGGWPCRCVSAAPSARRGAP